MNTVLSIAGSDSSGGAGIQADIKTILSNGCYAMTAITALTAQNTLGVTAIQDATPEVLTAQLDAVFTDIFPDAVKIGMVSSKEIICAIRDALTKHKAKNIVCDTVMVSTSGHRLIEEDAVEALKSELIPLATVITPNIPEAEVLSGVKITSIGQMMAAAKAIGDAYKVAVLVKGGHSIEDATDILYDSGEFTTFAGTRVNNTNTHGTGCTLSSAIASNLAKGYSLTKAIEKAKDYIAAALAANLNLGQGSGPLDHSASLTGEFMK